MTASLHIQILISVTAVTVLRDNLRFLSHVNSICTFEHNTL